jgi:hypothetical protein
VFVLHKHRARTPRAKKHRARDETLPSTLSTHAQGIIGLLRPAFLETGDCRVAAAIRELLIMQGELAADEVAGIVADLL